MWTPSENNLATTNPCSTSPLSEVRSTEQERVGGVSVISTHESRLLSGIKELLDLLRILGEGYRLSCSYKSQVCPCSFVAVLLYKVYMLVLDGCGHQRGEDPSPDMVQKEHGTE
jgi:hypothetical protein